MKKKFKMPSAFSILFIIIIIVALLTWFIPAGKYEYNEDKAPIPNTYHQTEATPQGIGDVILSPIKGFFNAVDVAFFIIVIGGFLGVVMKTGAIDAGIANVVKTFKGRESIMIPILMILFGLGGTTFGMAEETIAFYPLIIPVFIAAGYDSLTGAAVILLGAGAGVLGSTVNPFATGIASGFAGVSLGEGIILRLVLLILCELVSIFFVMSYAKKVKSDMSNSLMAEFADSNRKHFLEKDDSSEFPELTGRRKFVLALFIITFGIMIYAVIPFSDLGITFLPTLGWWFENLAALFFVASIIIGIVGGLNEDDLVGGFVDGARDLLGVALIIGVSRGITVIMNNGNITDTVLSYGENLLAGLGSIGFSLVTYLFYIPMSFLIPSTSGLATLSMPIMAPLGDFANVSRDIVITAYQSASGIVNLITPTSAVVMGGLAIARVPYNKWLQFTWKLLIVIMIIILASLAVATYI